MQRLSPEDVLLPLWKADRWLAEQADDPAACAWIVAAARAELRRATREEVVRALAESARQELRLVAHLELLRRGLA